MLRVEDLSKINVDNEISRLLDLLLRSNIKYIWELIQFYDNFVTFCTNMQSSLVQCSNLDEAYVIKCNIGNVTSWRFKIS